MSSERWERTKKILEEALRLAPQQRQSYLDRACRGDAELRAEVESLITSHEEAGSQFLAAAAPEILDLTLPEHKPLTNSSKLGDYEVQRLLGAGGMGEVYRARDLRLGRDVAIKVIPSSLSSDPDRLRRFEQEARAAAALNHINILAVFQMGTYEGAPYLVTELLEGETLREQLRRGPIPVRKAVDYGIQMARGLSAAHEKAIVHRDLKPENLFVTKDGIIKILDFGLAKLTERTTTETTSMAPTLDVNTEPGVVVGTAGYVSPEQVRGREADHRSDLFAFGAVMYEMLAGRRAFQKQTSVETMSAILNEDPPPISEFVLNTPPALQRVVHRCLEKNPAQRLQSALDLTFALEGLSDYDISSSRSTQVPLGSPRSWALVAAVATAVVALGVLVLWWRLPPALLQVEAVTQLTNDREPKESDTLVSDGSRIYFNEGQTGSWRIAQVSITGGQTGDVSTTLHDPQIVALAPDGSALLVLVGGSNDPRYPLWSIPLPAGEPRRLGEIEVQDANIFPDGHLVFSSGNHLYIADKDGSSAHQLVDVPQVDHVWAPAVSPDGKQIGFTAAGSSRELEEIA